MIVLIGGEKGGTGKTTIASNLATMRLINGHDVLLIDTDKQGSASAWSDIRDANNIQLRVPNVQKFGSNLASDIKNLQSRFEDIVIDAGGRDSIELRASMTVADILYIPVQASQFDIWTLSIMNDLVEQTKVFNTKLLSYVVINRATTNPTVSEVQEAQNVLVDFEHLMLSSVVLKERISYRKAAKNGQVIIELDKKDPKAEGEIKELYNEVFNAK